MRNSIFNRNAKYTNQQTNTVGESCYFLIHCLLCVKRIQSEKMVIIYDKSDTDFIVQLNTFYKRIFVEAEEFYLNATVEEIKKGSFRSIL